MHKFYLFCAIIGWLLQGSVVAAASFQVPVAATGAAAASGVPLGTQRYLRTAYVLTPAELREAGFVAGKTLTGIGFAYSAAPGAATTGTFRVYLQNTADATYAKASASWTSGGTGIVDDMTLVHAGSLTLPATGGTLDVSFAGGSAFVYAGGGLHVAFEYQNATGSLAPLAAAAAGTSSLAGGLRTATSATALPASLPTAASARPLTRLAYAAPSQAGVVEVYTLGTLYLPGALPHVVSALVANNGEAPLANLPVTLQLSGSVSYTSTQTVASLPVGASVLVSFPALTAASGLAPGMRLGVQVSVPADDNAADNARQLTQTVSASRLGYADASPAVSGIGFDTGAGTMLARYHVSQLTQVSAVQVHLANDAASVGNTVYGVLFDASGQLLARSPDHVLASAELGDYYTFAFPMPMLVAGTDFYVGLAQTANPASGYFPVDVQAEGPPRSGAYYDGELTGNLQENPYNGRLMLEAVLAAGPLPVTLVGVQAQRTATAATALSWRTASELANSYFAVERSADGVAFAPVGRVSAAAAGSQGASYQYLDAGAAAWPSQLLYYRLRQVDVDGASQYSPVVTAAPVALATPALAPAYPNPVATELHLEHLPPGAQVQVHDMAGRLVCAATAAEPTLQLPTASWAAGVYCLQVRSDGHTLLVQRLTK